ncbi:MAG: hypothetical protein RBJ76_25565 [Stenomitos frigidus ULC029]
MRCCSCCDPTHPTHVLSVAGEYDRKMSGAIVLKLKTQPAARTVKRRQFKAGSA